MQILDKNYIDGQWVRAKGKAIDVINPANEEIEAQLISGTVGDIDQAVSAARRAFESFGKSSKEERLELLSRIIAAYQAKMDRVAEAVTLDMGAPKWLATNAHATAGLGHFLTAKHVLEKYDFGAQKDGFYLQKEPIGVCGFITPWNWPMNQIACKLGPALATGCSVIWKPSEMAPRTANILM